MIAACGAFLAACSPSDTADAGAALTPPSATPDRVRSCGDLGYAAQTDNGAFAITATGVDCSAARQVASWSQGFPPTFTAHGFTCRTPGPRGQLPSYPYTCTNGGARITFKAS